MRRTIGPLNPPGCKANPNYGVSVKVEFLAREMRRAIASAHLAEHREDEAPEHLGGCGELEWMNMAAFAKCADAALKIGAGLRRRALLRAMTWAQRST